LLADGVRESRSILEHQYRTLLELAVGRARSRESKPAEA
jgi:hypothetical protein